MINSLGYTVFAPKESLKLAKFSHFAEKMAELKKKNLKSKKRFQASIEKTVHIQEWIMILKVVVNNIVDIIQS